jgi:hypothetical protein
MDVTIRELFGLDMLDYNFVAYSSKSVVSFGDCFKECYGIPAIEHSGECSTSCVLVVMQRRV